MMAATLVIGGSIGAKSKVGDGSAILKSKVADRDAVGDDPYLRFKADDEGYKADMRLWIPILRCRTILTPTLSKLQPLIFLSATIAINNLEFLQQPCILGGCRNPSILSVGEAFTGAQTRTTGEGRTCRRIRSLSICGESKTRPRSSEFIELLDYVGNWAYFHGQMHCAGTMLPEGMAPFTHITRNERSGRKQIKKKEEDDIAVCECKFDPGHTVLACGERCLNVLTNTECTPGYCPCGTFCKNQRFQKCEYAKTKLFKTEGRGWGLLADENIKKKQRQDLKLMNLNSQGLRDAYIISLNASYFIDATGKGSLDLKFKRKLIGRHLMLIVESEAAVGNAVYMLLSFYNHDCAEAYCMMLLGKTNTGAEAYYMMLQILEDRCWKMCAIDVV
ncbi:hypothetical protein LXL04_006019 [Taraxacum kok-saghyz]